jgi:hypothetical protein
MNKSYTILSLLTVLLFANSCQKDFLAPPPYEIQLGAKDVFADKLRADGFLAVAYNNMLTFGGLTQTAPAYGQGYSMMCDEAKAAHGFLVPNSYNTASLDASNMTSLDNKFTTSYPIIRRCNIIIANEPNMTFDAGEAKSIVAQARFLRAFVYFELLKRYGGVPIETKPVDGGSILSEEALAAYKSGLKRSSFEELVNFIAKELDDVAAVLPWTPPSGQEGRATSAGALAIKGRLLLYAASPLFNSSSTADMAKSMPFVGYTNYDINRWKIAADAIKAFFTKNMENGNPYKLSADYAKTFTECNQASFSQELIWYHQSNDMSGQEIFFLPPGAPFGSWAHYNVTLNHVDKYEMTSGRSIDDPLSGYSDQKYATNRDPRLNLTVHKHNDAFRSGTMDFTMNTGKNWAITCQSGFILKKFMTPDGNYGSFRSKWPHIRLAEMYLNLAEALNEFSGPSKEVFDAVGAVRARVSMPRWETVYPNLTQSQLRDKIRNERSVELAFENHRHWDCHRWLISEVVDNGKIYGFNITKNADNTFKYDRFVYEERKFLKRMYLQPIPQAETFKGADIQQNPGY